MSNAPKCLHTLQKILQVQDLLSDLRSFAVRFLMCVYFAILGMKGLRTFPKKL